MSGAAEQVCGNCGAVHGPDDIFCESCGYDFITGSLPSPEEANRLGIGGGPDGAPADGSGAPSTGSTAASGPPLPVPRIRFEVGVDRLYFDAVVSEGELEFPDPAPAPKEIEVVGAEIHIGRTSQSRAIHPDLDIADLTGDPAVSSRHAVVRVGADGVLTVTDVGSTNGTIVGLPTESTIPEGQPRPVADGAAFYVGAWTRIIVTRLA
ncbi:MAG: FHA domain-containing protein [Acidimicrobiales bacterium]